MCNQQRECSGGKGIGKGQLSIRKTKELLRVKKVVRKVPISL